MFSLRNWALCLIALGVFCISPNTSEGQTFLGRGFGVQKCFYRVYYKMCDSDCWKIYATYADCKSAQQAVGFLKLTGRDAYQATWCGRQPQPNDPLSTGP